MLGAKKARRLIAPEVQQRLAGEGIDAVGVGLFEFVDRKQLDRGHAQLLEVRNLLDESGKGAGIRDPDRGMHG